MHDRYGMPSPSAHMNASKGCLFKCNFCRFSRLFSPENSYKIRAISEVADEMEYLVKKEKFKSIYFDDANFNTGKKRIFRFCQKIKKRNLQTTPWAIMARPDLMDEEILEEMKSAGLFLVKYGIESAVPEIQERSGKNLDIDKTVRIVRKTKALGVQTHLTFIFGLAGESRKTLRKTIDFAFALNPSSLQFFIATHLPGEKGSDLSEKEGFPSFHRQPDCDGLARSRLRRGRLTDEKLEEVRKRTYFLWDWHCKRRNGSHFRTLKYKLMLHLRAFGLPYTFKKVCRCLCRGIKKLRIYCKLSCGFKKLRYLFDRDSCGDILRLAGAMYGYRPYAGPYIGQIDLTDECNNNCIGCWCNSPLINNTESGSRKINKKLPFESIKNLIDDLCRMRTKEIYLAGGGEPFMHPDLLEVVRYIKSKKMTAYINTNFTLVNDSVLRELVNTGLDYLTVSIWAGTPKTYVATHPNKDEDTFFRIKEMLKTLSLLKKDNKKNKPKIKIYNVISSINYHEIEEMIDFALDTGAEEIEFAAIDVIPGKTDTLLLTREQRDELFDQLGRLEYKIFSLQESGYLNFIQLDLFLRRLSGEGALKGEYDKYSIDGLPCYVGWVFSRILANGDVTACLKLHKVPVGNIKEQPFTKIWGGPKQRVLREKMKIFDKNSTLFSLVGNDPKAKIGCYRICDDICRNLNMMDKISKLSRTDKLFLWGVAKLLDKIKYFHHAS